jgi:predicted XRE-type DNA-binding protein
MEQDAARAGNLQLSSSLMLALRRQIENQGLSQTGAAKVFLITQARISSLLRSNIELFGLDMLVNMLAAARQVKVTVKKAS